MLGDKAFDVGAPRLLVEFDNIKYLANGIYMTLASCGRSLQLILLIIFYSALIHIAIVKVLQDFHIASSTCQIFSNSYHIGVYKV